MYVCVYVCKTSNFLHLMPGLHSCLGYSSRLLVRCERDNVRTNVDIYTLVQESSITRQDIRDILVFFDLGLIYRHVSESFEIRREQIESVEDETSVPFTLPFSSFLVLSRRECKPGITMCKISIPREIIPLCIVTIF